MRGADRWLVPAAVAVTLTACAGGPTPVRDTSAAPVPAYSADSVWNTRIEPDPAVHPDSRRLVRRLGSAVTSDPTQYTMAVYDAAPGSSTVPLHVRGNFSDVRRGGQELRWVEDVRLRVPLPEDAIPPSGSDGHIVVVDPTTGDEWGFWQTRRNGNGTWTATNGYHYDLDWSGVPPAGFGSRGSGVPYLAGLVRKAEVDHGRIEHAVAFAYRTPSCGSVWPATKSDGKGDLADDLPQGARLQLDPTLDEEDFDAWGLTRTGRIIARALQEFGMVLIDVSGRTKIYLEAQHTALWTAEVTERTITDIPVSALRVLDHRGEVSTHSCRRR